MHRQLHDSPQTRRSARSHFRTLYVGLEVHHDSSAVAYLAKDYDAEAIPRGTIGPRHGDSDHLIRMLQAKAKQLAFVSEAGPCGYWLYRY